MIYRVTFSKDNWQHAVEVSAEDTVEAASEAWNKIADDGVDPNEATKLVVELIA